ncbi:hypothetical protein VEZ01S_01_01770 [Vibrio ezurae NBRC 102218]|uniref:Uncharacterized protein n=1 Tax=Vibrio ezurae NBRC 102218 TaxID=1219080 RepID=U3CJL5_9VIBR|nr:hypothetical protein VEZ01S_01_01770 [Vibrio ezurae NBRC 102218]
MANEQDILWFFNFRGRNLLSSTWRYWSVDGLFNDAAIRQSKNKNGNGSSACCANKRK